MTQLKALVVVAFGSLALVACDRNDRVVSEKSEEKINSAKDKTAKELEELGDKIEKKAVEVKDEVKKDLDSPPKGTGGGPAVAGSREWARDTMAKVRCAHYQTCGDVADGKKYDTMDSCTVRERASLDKDWDLGDCAKIDQPRLDACVTAVKAKKCDALFDTTPSECAKSKVCIEP